MRRTAARKFNAAMYGLLSGENVRLEYVGFDQDKAPNKVYRVSIQNEDNQPRATASLVVTVRDRSADLVYQHLAKIEELLNSVDADLKFRDNQIIVRYIWLAEESGPLYDTKFELVKAIHSYTIRFIDNEEANS